MKEVTFDSGFKLSIDDIKSEKSDTTSDFATKRKREPPSDIVKKIYTDGGSRRIPTADRVRYVGAWAFYDEFANELIGESQDDATNNAMELTAVIKALEHMDLLGVPKDRWVYIYTDSDYVRFGATAWCLKWEASGWKRYDDRGNPLEIKNLELWKKLLELLRSRKVWFVKVEGHSGIEGNEKVDIECGRLMDKFIVDNDIIRVQKDMMNRRQKQK